jgi:hypothetical protein
MKDSGRRRMDDGTQDAIARLGEDSGVHRFPNVASGVMENVEV